MSWRRNKNCRISTCNTLIHLYQIHAWSCFGLWPWTNAQLRRQFSFQGLNFCVLPSLSFFLLSLIQNWQAQQTVYLGYARGLPNVIYSQRTFMRSSLMSFCTWAIIKKHFSLTSIWIKLRLHVFKRAVSLLCHWHKCAAGFFSWVLLDTLWKTRQQLRIQTLMVKEDVISKALTVQSGRNDDKTHGRLKLSQKHNNWLFKLALVEWPTCQHTSS